MDSASIAEWMRQHGEPMPDLCKRPSYRCAAYLTDGTYLPCVQMREAEAHARFAIRRFQDAHASGVTDPKQVTHHYPSLVKSFVASGNHVNDYDIGELEPSPYAIPWPILRTLQGETAMSWTAFAGVMDDDAEFSFGTTFSTEFFDMPPGYTGQHIRRIISHKGDTRPVYRQRPFFVCFLTNIEFGAT